MSKEATEETFGFTWSSSGTAWRRSRRRRGGSSLREQLRSAWLGFERWHLSNPDASNFIRQCEVSRVLISETRARPAELEAEGRTNYAPAVDRGIIWEMPVRVFHALFAGPSFELAHTRGRQDMEIGDKELHLAFEGGCRSVLRNPE